MNRRTALAASSAAFAGVGCTTAAPPPGDREALVRQVRDTELAFARTMADRDHDAFARFVADDAVFLNGGKPLRGKAAIVAHWRKWYEGPTPPFGWRPEVVEVVGSGTLAQSLGPVFDPEGQIVARFYSTWRREPDGLWRIVLDNGDAVCERRKT